MNRNQLFVLTFTSVIMTMVVWAGLLDFAIDESFEQLLSAILLGPIALVFSLISGMFSFQIGTWYLILFSWPLWFTMISPLIERQSSISLAIVSWLYLSMITMGVIFGSLIFLWTDQTGSQVLAETSIVLVLNVFAIPLGFIDPINQIPRETWLFILVTLVISLLITRRTNQMMSNLSLPEIEDSSVERERTTKTSREQFAVTGALFGVFGGVTAWVNGFVDDLIGRVIGSIDSIVDLIGLIVI